MRGLSLAGAASRGNVSKSALAGWESGRRVPSGEALSGLLRALGAGEREAATLLAVADPRYARVALAETSLGAPVHLGDALRAMRLRRGLGQTDLARKADVNQSTVARWEAGDLVPEAEKLQAIFSHLEARAEEIEALVRFGTVREDDPHERTRAVYEAPHALQELLWLALEGELWWRTEPDAASLLLRVRGRRVQWYHYAGRTAEAIALARRGRRGSGAGRGRPHLPRRLLRAPDRPAIETARLCGTSGRWSGGDRVSASPRSAPGRRRRPRWGLRAAGERSAIDLASRAMLGASDGGLGFEEVVYRRIDLAEVHLLLGDPGSRVADGRGRRHARGAARARPRYDGGERRGLPLCSWRRSARSPMRTSLGSSRSGDARSSAPPSTSSDGSPVCEVRSTLGRASVKAENRHRGDQRRGRP